tara:strand:- start:847 stop:1221 length:375 start_codon:yes stop_codon:yes gene_type:complete
LEGIHKAIDIYQGKSYELVRSETLNNIKVFILSAKHGLLKSNTMIENYELKMDEKRSRELIKQGTPFELEGEVYVYGGKNYRNVVNAWFDNVTELVGPNRGNFDHYSALKQFVEKNQNIGRLPL